MNKNQIIVSGLTIAADRDLCNELDKIAGIIQNKDNNRLISILIKQPVDLILLEFSNNVTNELEMIRQIKNLFPKMNIILINGNGDRNVIARAFEYGVRDAFKRPHNLELIVERVNAVIKKTHDA